MSDRVDRHMMETKNAVAEEAKGQADAQHMAGLKDNKVWEAQCG
jgi:hypothetical protein